jgi:hypothetical protein
MLKLPLSASERGGQNFAVGGARGAVAMTSWLPLVNLMRANAYLADAALRALSQDRL